MLDDSFLKQVKTLRSIIVLRGNNRTGGALQDRDQGMRNTILLLILVTISSGSTWGMTSTSRGVRGPQRPAVVRFRPHPLRSAYESKHPRVLFDEAHDNADTSFGRYKPFV